MLNDLVSIIIPVYNTNTRFRDCFKSVLKQIYTNIEVILVDDGSSDESAQFCDEFATETDGFTVYVIHKKNGGVSRARNLGIDFANGKYIVFIDSDDQVTPNYISDFMDVREKYPDAGHIWCGFMYKSNDLVLHFDSGNDLVSTFTREDFFYLNDKILTQGPCMKLFDIAILRDNNIRMLESLSLAEDILFNLEYLDIVPSQKIYVINSPNYIYIDLNSNSLKNKYRKDLYEIYKYFLKRLQLYLEKWEITDIEAVIRYSNMVFFNYSTAMKNTFNSKNKDTLWKKIQTNNIIMKSEEFVHALSHMTVKLSPSLLKAYKTQNYFWVWIYEKIGAIYNVRKRC